VRFVVALGALVICLLVISAPAFASSTPALGGQVYELGANWMPEGMVYVFQNSGGQYWVMHEASGAVDIYTAAAHQVASTTYGQHAIRSVIEQTGLVLGRGDTVPAPASGDYVLSQAERDAITRAIANRESDSVKRAWLARVGERIVGGSMLKLAARASGWGFGIVTAIQIGQMIFHAKSPALPGDGTMLQPSKIGFVTDAGAMNGGSCGQVEGVSSADWGTMLVAGFDLGGCSQFWIGSTSSQNGAMFAFPGTQELAASGSCHKLIAVPTGFHMSYRANFSAPTGCGGTYVPFSVVADFTSLMQTLPHPPGRAGDPTPNSTVTVPQPNRPTDSELTSRSDDVLHDPEAQPYVDDVITENGGPPGLATPLPPGVIDPTPTDPALIRIPLPGVTETYPAYLARLQALGLVGTAIEAPADAIRPELGAEVVIQTNPAPGTAVATGTEVRVFYNPAYMPDPADTSGETGNPTDPATGEPAPCVGGCPGDIVPPGITFPSISTPCNVFPFGVPCWVKNQVTSLDASPVAPHLSWPTPYGAMEVDAGNIWGYDFGSVMTVVRPILLLTSLVGIVFWLASFSGMGSDSGSTAPRDGEDD